MTAYGTLVSAELPDTTYTEETIGNYIAGMLLATYNKENTDNNGTYPQIDMTGVTTQYNHPNASAASVDVSFKGKGQAQPQSTAAFDGLLTIVVSDTTYRFDLDADFLVSNAISGTIKLTDTAKEHTLTLGQAQ